MTVERHAGARPGMVDSVIVAVFGVTSTNEVVESPAESVAVRYTRYQTLADASPLFGMANVPLAMPDRLQHGGVRVRVVVEVDAPAESGRCRACRLPGRFALPENDSVVAGGVRRVRRAGVVYRRRSGRRWLSTVSVAELLVTVPAEFVTRHR